MGEEQCTCPVHAQCRVDGEYWYDGKERRGERNKMNELMGGGGEVH